MRPVLLLLLGAHLAYAGKHSLKYFFTAVSGDIDFPEFTIVGLVDEGQFMYFDSNTKRVVPKTEWIRQNEGADYWEQQTQIGIGQHQAFKNNIQVAKERFNQSTGVHTVQQMYGCEWDDQTGANDGFHQFGYDGEDFLSLDLKELRWISPVPQGIITALKWNYDRGQLEMSKQYFSTVCIEWLQKYLQYGKSSLQKTVSPQVSLLQKSSSSSVSCHATGFYPSGVTITWMRNGQEHHEDVDVGELLPNEDGTFQRTSTITVTPDEWKKNKFSCVVEHQGKTKTANEIVTNPALFTGTHSLRYFYTAVSGVRDFPEYTSVGLLDDEQFDYFDSNIMKTVPKTEWMKQNVGADYWDKETQTNIGTHQTFKNNIQIAQARFNQSTGVHTVQFMYGCEMDDDGTRRGYMQYGYDGEDYISFDKSTLTWTAANPQAVITKHKWEANRAIAEQNKGYLENTCIEWLQKYVGYGKSTLERKDAPEVFLLQKDSSSPVLCQATGFYPSNIMMTWQKNGQEHYEDVDVGRTLPNADGTFQRAITLSVEEWKKNKNDFRCVVQHVGAAKDIVVTVDDIRSNTERHSLQYIYTVFIKPDGFSSLVFSAVGLYMMTDASHTAVMKNQPG